MKRIQIAAANWKMNLDLAQADRRIDDILAAGSVMSAVQLTVFAVPFPYLLAYAVDEDHVHVAALLHVRLNPKSHEAALHSRS